MNNKKFLIVDDHEIIRIGTGNLLSNRYQGCTIMEAGNEEKCIRLVKSNSFDLVILDVNIPYTDTLGLTRNLLNYDPTLPILIFSVNPSTQYAAQYFKSGVKGYINKDAHSSEILRAVDLVLNNRSYMDQEFQDSLVETKIHHGGPEHLTEREFQVAQYLARGLAYKDIAQLLYIEMSSVRTHKKNIFRKLKVNSLFEFLQIFNKILPAKQ